MTTGVALPRTGPAQRAYLERTSGTGELRLDAGCLASSASGAIRTAGEQAFGDACREAAQLS